MINRRTDTANTHISRTLHPRTSSQRATMSITTSQIHRKLTNPIRIRTQVANHRLDNASNISIRHMIQTRINKLQTRTDQRQNRHLIRHRSLNFMTRNQARHQTQQQRISHHSQNLLFTIPIPSIRLFTQAQRNQHHTRRIQRQNRNQNHTISMRTLNQRHSRPLQNHARQLINRMLIMSIIIRRRHQRQIPAASNHANGTSQAPSILRRHHTIIHSSRQTQSTAATIDQARIQSSQRQVTIRHNKLITIHMRTLRHSHIMTMRSTFNSISSHHKTMRATNQRQSILNTKNNDPTATQPIHSRRITIHQNTNHAINNDDNLQATGSTRIRRLSMTFTNALSQTMTQRLADIIISSHTNAIVNRQRRILAHTQSNQSNTQAIRHTSTHHQDHINHTQQRSHHNPSIRKQRVRIRIRSFTQITALRRTSLSNLRLTNHISSQRRNNITLISHMMQVSRNTASTIQISIRNNNHTHSTHNTNRTNRRNNHRAISFRLRALLVKAAKLITIRPKHSITTHEPTLSPAVKR